jgi:GTP cyclohydrolase I
MAKDEFLQSEYQKDVISGYYSNLDTILLQKLGELVTELYLAETPARRDRLWQRAHKAMLKLKVQPAIVRHIMEKQDVEILAKNLKDWLNPGKRK